MLIGTSHSSLPKGFIRIGTSLETLPQVLTIYSLSRSKSQSLCSKAIKESCIQTSTHLCLSGELQTRQENSNFNVWSLTAMSNRSHAQLSTYSQSGTRNSRRHHWQHLTKKLPIYSKTGHGNSTPKSTKSPHAKY